MSWKLEYLFLLILSTTIDYYIGIKIGEAQSKILKKRLLYISLFSNLGMLFFFKYFNFFSESANSIFQAVDLGFSLPYSQLLLPVGISFYIFQSLSYTIDVFNGIIQPERHWGRFAVFVSFFPQLVAGPIERAKNLLPQFYIRHEFNIKNFSEGSLLILWGFFKKVVIADRLAEIVNSVYNNPGDFNALTLSLATFLFAYQIYCDFSGYSDIAIGSAKILGFDLMTNFNRPYFAKTISEFWKRWHISLSTWFKDYLYITLGGNRVKVSRWYFNLFVVFLVSGFWHGANWTFLVWGALHGVYLVVSIVMNKQKMSLKNLIAKYFSTKVMSLSSIFITFLLVNIAWIFFRANNISDAILICKKIFFEFSSIFTDIFMIGSGANVLKFNEYGISKTTLVLSLFFIALLELAQIVMENERLKRAYCKVPEKIKSIMYVFLFLAIIIFGVFENTEFIYFQF